MRCSHCGICCEKTEMMLSSEDIERLEKAGCNKQLFLRFDKHGFARLRNNHGFCVFYDVDKSRCKIYRHRPSGCRIYPVIYSERDGIIVDDLCPMKNTISRKELKKNGEKVMELLQRIYKETALRNMNT